MLPIPVKENYWRITVFLTNGQKTITETHWLVDFTASLQDANNVAFAVLARRTVLCGDDVGLCSYRISQENIWRDSDIDTFTNPASKPGATPVFGVSDIAGKNVLIRAQSTQAYRKSLYLGLLPDDFWKGTVFTGYDDAAWLTAWQSYKKILLTGQTSGTTAKLGFLALDKGNPFTTMVKLSGITVPAVNVPTFEVTAPVAFTVNKDDVVRIYFSQATYLSPQGVQTSGIFNQVYQVLGQVGQVVTLVIPPNTVLSGYTGILKPGKISKLTKIVVPYDNIISESTGTHKRGDRTGLSRGRSLKKKVAQ